MGGSRSELLPLMAASAGAGMVARIPCHPIDTCKSRLQVQISGVQASQMAKAAAASGGQPPRATYAYRHFGDAFIQIARTEGLAGLYRGFGITFWGSAPASCLYFTTYELASKDLRQLPALHHHSYAADFSAGLVAEAIACIIYVPIDVIKERLQIQVHRSSVGARAILVADNYYYNSLDAIRKVMRSEGLSGMYRGYAATLASFGPFSALYFMFYQQLKNFASDDDGYQDAAADPPPLTFWKAFLCGAGAGSAASFITNPLDMVKLRLQVQRAGAADVSKGQASALPAFRYTGMVDGLGKIIRHEGIFGLFKGAGARMIFHIPTTAISIAAFEKLKAAFGSV